MAMQVFLLCLLAGCSISWFNTVCFVLCIRNFPVNRSLALSLTISFNGVSAALYTLASNALDGSSSTYLLLNATLPVLASAAALLPILRQPPTHLLLLPPDANRRDFHVFLLLNVLAFLTGLYLLLLNSVSSDPVPARILLAGAIILLLLPLCIPGIVCARDWTRRIVYSRLVTNNVHDVDLRKELIRSTNININIHENDSNNGNCGNSNNDRIVGEERWWRWWSQRCCCCEGVMEKNRLVAIGEEHGVKRLIGRIDFWLYYVAYFCGATVGLVYSNNLGQIAQSLGMESKTTMFLTVYSSCSFFGRLLSAAPDFLRGFVYI